MGKSKKKSRKNNSQTNGGSKKNDSPSKPAELACANVEKSCETLKNGDEAPHLSGSTNPVQITAAEDRPSSKQPETRASGSSLNPEASTFVLKNSNSQGKDIQQETETKREATSEHNVTTVAPQHEKEFSENQESKFWNPTQSVDSAEDWDHAEIQFGPSSSQSGLENEKSTDKLGARSSTDQAWDGWEGDKSSYSNNTKNKKGGRDGHNWRATPRDSGSDRSTSLADPRMQREGQRQRSSSNKRSRERGDKSKDVEKEFVNWEKHPDITDFKIVQEIQGDLFAQPEDYSLAHCVAEDLRMGSGIAVDFKKTFKELPTLLNQRAKQGGLAVLQASPDRYIYYLVTKRESTGKPTYYTLWKSLQKMKEHITKHQVKKLAIPRLGCGLDRLDWVKVKSMLEYTFKDLAFEIRVCNFQQAEDAEPKRSYTCRVVSEAYHITKIAAGTAIFYFTTEDAHQDDTMNELAKKYNYLMKFKNHGSIKKGDVIIHKDRQDYLFGCVVRSTIKDPFDFVAFAKCISQFMKANSSYKNDAFIYVGFQSVDTRSYANDHMLNEKIITLMMNLCRQVDIYVCYGDVSKTSTD